MTTTRAAATKYSTWMQLGQPPKAAEYIQVIEVWIKRAEPVSYTLLNLDGKLSTSTISHEDLISLIEKGKIKPWTPTGGLNGK